MRNNGLGKTDLLIYHVDFKETLGRVMLQEPIFPKGHHLTGYHYSGEY